MWSDFKFFSSFHLWKSEREKCKYLNLLLSTEEICRESQILCSSTFPYHFYTPSDCLLQAFSNLFLPSPFLISTRRRRRMHISELPQIVVELSPRVVRHNNNILSSRRVDLSDETSWNSHKVRWNFNFPPRFYKYLSFCTFIISFLCLFEPHERCQNYTAWNIYFGENNKTSRKFFHQPKAQLKQFFQLVQCSFKGKFFKVLGGILCL